jgi:hypothetical protein
MPLTLIKEDGSGLANANSYASVAEGDAFHAGHLYATDWTGANADIKAAALVMASRLIDALHQFRGFRAHSAQALQWPRERARDDDALAVRSISGLSSGSEYFANNALPAALVSATCETARELIKRDRTAEPDELGLQTLALTGTLSVAFDKLDRADIVPPVAAAWLAKLGSRIRAGSGAVKLVRT